MQDVWIALDARARRVNWLWTGLLSLVFACMAAAIYLPDQGDPHPSATERWWWFAVIGACWLASCIYMVNRGYGSTKLARDGMRFRSFFTRRFIAWGEITQIEKHQHLTRSGSWWDIRVRIAGGQKRHVPGAFTFNSSRKSRRALDQTLETINSYWASAAGLDRRA
jgi:hypothetical protein